MRFLLVFLVLISGCYPEPAYRTSMLTSEWEKRASVKLKLPSRGMAVLHSEYKNVSLSFDKDGVLQVGVVGDRWDLEVAGKLEHLVAKTSDKCFVFIGSGHAMVSPKKSRDRGLITIGGCKE